MAFAIAACKKDERRPTTASEGAPDPVSNTQVQNTPGGAKITYTIPGNKDLMYIKAVFTTASGTREVKSSVYNNFLKIEGYGDTLEHEVKLYAVNRADEQSEPVSVTIKPLEPPVITVRKSITTQADFGGMALKFLNPAEAEVSIHVLTDSAGSWIPVNILYTKRASGIFSVRGFANVMRKFGVFVKDRWDNHSDTLEVSLVPLFEMELNRLLMKEQRYPSDAALIATDWNIAKLFDNLFPDISYHSAVGTGMPQWFTVDLGMVSTLSRCKMWQRAGNIFNYANVKKFEIWGSNSPSDAWSSWTLLGTFEGLKPSGLPTGNISAEDISYAAAGEEFVFPPGIPAVRYIRFKTTETWGGVAFVHINELRFWGVQ